MRRQHPQKITTGETSVHFDHAESGYVTPPPLPVFGDGARPQPSFLPGFQAGQSLEDYARRFNRTYFVSGRTYQIRNNADLNLLNAVGNSGLDPYIVFARLTKCLNLEERSQQFRQELPAAEGLHEGRLGL